MSKCIYKEIANNLDKEKFTEFYMTHTGEQTCNEFGFHYRYLYRILHYLNIDVGNEERKSYIINNIVVTEEFRQKVSASGKGRKHSEETIEKIRKGNRGRKITYGDKISKTLKNKYKSGEISVWNKGKQGLQKWTEEQWKKYYTTISDNGWYIKSKPEEKLYDDLCFEYGKENIIRQYMDNRYPFKCDFYIKTTDTFIELNRFWHHGNHPFDENDEKDIEKLNEWKEKAKNSKSYENAVYTWTVRDVKKQETAKKNGLNYIVIY